MNKKLAQRENQKGFTLIELLIVIVIIGILAGIVITILNPARQQSRARDGVIVATMNKIVADVRAQAAADISGAGSLPTCGQLSTSLQNVTNVSAGCTAASNTGTFEIQGVQDNTAANVTFTYSRSSVATSQNFCLSAVANDTSSGNGFIAYGYVSGASNFTQPQRSAAACPAPGSIP